MSCVRTAREALTGVGVLVVLAGVATIVNALLSSGCYPTPCNPKTDPLRCECPSGPCGPYPGETKPGAPKDAGADG